ncbi:Na/Pi symporter [Sediminibacillus albus]|uniref:Phosphate:Na+ symporter n=1 Tax=Sediminibacillus albus TaxID=407036 RepID=A0A1G9CP15_9BACI|nr:Na/Pi symporter [Sediminibacillus albus]SDK53431.1 phosphate:Na+ symporter [Sediminibacillus albus]
MADFLSLSAVFLMLFFLGFQVLRTGLYQLTFTKVETLLAEMTQNHYIGIMTGLLATAVLQSSSLIMILTISFVSVGLLTFKQSLGIILGANIGTTITGELLTFSQYIPEWGFVVLGSLFLLSNMRVLFGLGTILFGIGSIFIALNGFESLAPLIIELPILSDGIKYTDLNPEIGVLVGMFFSGAIQSSSATTGITMSFLNEGLISMAASIAIILGANIGTCLTAVLAALGTKKQASLTAMAHVWFNILSVLLFLPFLTGLSTLAEYLSVYPIKQLAHISVLFNVASVLLFLPFIGVFERFILRLHGNKP